MMADFQNGLISGIISVFSSGFLHRTTLMICRMDFDMFFGILIFDPNPGFCKAYTLCMMADFQNGLICGIFSVFPSRFYEQNKSKRFVEWILTCFLEFKFLTQSEDFAKPIAFA